MGQDLTDLIQIALRQQRVADGQDQGPLDAQGLATRQPRLP
jgi:hypothetical protein